MIVVNLLPEELRPIKRTPLPHLLSLLVAALALVAIGAVYLAAVAEIGERRAELADTQEKLQALQATVEDFKKLKDKLNQLDRKLKVIEDITKDRIIWSERLHQLVTLTPDNFWYKSIEETSQTITVEREEVDEKTGATKIVRDRVLQPYLVVSGYVGPDEEGSDDPYPLSVNTTREDSEFAQKFILEKPEYKFGTYADQRIQTFKFDYRIETGGEE